MSHKSTCFVLSFSLQRAGYSSSFLGRSAGYNTTGYENSFFGSGAGGFNTTGNYNSFFGTSVGVWNTTGYGRGW